MVPDTATMRKRIRAAIKADLSDAPVDEVGQATLRDFAAMRREPKAVDVQFSGGVMGQGWVVTRPNGPYVVVYLPQAGCFSLCVEGPFGPLDIGVHGNAIGCFGSV